MNLFKGNGCGEEVLENKETKLKKYFKRFSPIFLIVISIIIILLFFNSKDSLETKLVVDCLNYQIESLIDKKSFELTENPKLYVFDDKNYEHSYTYVVISYKAKNALGSELKNHGFYYVEPDLSKFEYIGNDEDFVNWKDAIYKEMVQLHYMVMSHGWDSAETIHEFDKDKIIKKCKN